MTVKCLWPNDWDGTVASHPRESETYVSSAERRMPEEIGIRLQDELRKQIRISCSIQGYWF